MLHSIGSQTGSSSNNKPSRIKIKKKFLKYNNEFKLSRANNKNTQY